MITTWLAVGAAASVASMVAFGAVRRSVLRSAGVTVPLRQTVAVSYAAGALHTTMPAGGVFSTTYAFRYLRLWGASASVATWCMAITGLLATVSLSALGLLGIALSAGTGGSALTSTVDLVVVVFMIAGLVHVTRHPAVLMRAAEYALRTVNRLRRRPAENGYARLVSLRDDLWAIRPAPRDWAVGLAYSLLNWLLDVACLATCCAALGVHLGLGSLLITYTAGMAAASLSPLPGGIGIVEPAMVLGLTTAGVSASAALITVVAYRLLSTGSVVVIGSITLARQRKTFTTRVVSRTAPAVTAWPRKAARSSSPAT